MRGGLHLRKSSLCKYTEAASKLDFCKTGRRLSKMICEKIGSFRLDVVTLTASKDSCCTRYVRENVIVCCASGMRGIDLLLGKLFLLKVKLSSCEVIT